MKLRQTKERPILDNPRNVQIGEVDHEIDWASMDDAPRPEWDPATLAACSGVFRRYVLPGTGALIPRHVFADLPPWIFLEYAVQFGGVLLHGSSNPSLDHLEPVKLSENLIGWNRPRHFAFDTAAEAMFAAVLDIDVLRTLDCQRRCNAVGPSSPGGKKLYFGIDYRALPFAPWRPGMVYLFSAAEFPDDYDDRPFLSEQPILPLAKIHVVPLDWPMLEMVDGVNVVEVNLRNRETYRGYPWRQDRDAHPGAGLRPEVELAKRYLKENLDRPVDLERLGHLTGLGPFRVLRLFRAYAGVSPREYQMRLRIEGAKKGLREGHAIAAVAIDAGFADQSHLTRQFRLDVGLTPGKYLLAQESSIR